jgi:hypothetical protein
MSISSSSVVTKYYSVSVGNYFIAAAQGFFRSLPSAIFLFSSITNSQVDGGHVLAYAAAHLVSG